MPFVNDEYGLVWRAEAIFTLKDGFNYGYAGPSYGPGVQGETDAETFIGTLDTFSVDGIPPLIRGEWFNFVLRPTLGIKVLL